jgi:acyl carrier protein
MTNLTNIDAVNLAQKCLDRLRKSEVLEADIFASPETVLIGDGSQLDSVGFVTFISDLEGQVNDFLGTDIYIVIPDIQGIDSSDSTLTLGKLAQYLISITNLGTIK